MKLYKNSFSTGEEISIELDERDKWWIKKVFERNINNNSFDDFENDEIETIEIWFTLNKDKIPVPILKNGIEPDLIEIYSKEEIKDILENSKSKVRKRFYYTHIEV